MIKLVILFRQPDDVTAFEPRYNQNLALMEQMPGIRRRQGCLVFGSPGGQSPYYRLLELYFDDRASLDAALTSPQGRAAGSDLIQFAGRDVELLFCDVFED